MVRNIMSNEEFFNIIDNHMEHLQNFYNVFAEKKPVMELSLPSQKIYAYPYSDYLNALNPRSQKILKDQYSKAIKNNEMVVFVVDKEKETVKSSTFPILLDQSKK